MKKYIGKLLCFCLIMILTATISGCHMKHEWQEATCESPKTCVVGGEMEGEPLGHDWVEATCETPKTCTRCGATEGEALGHDWTNATCEDPKTCKRCGAVEGEALGHDFDFATTEKPKTCRICGKTEGNPVLIETYDISKYYDGYGIGAFNEELLRFSRRLHKDKQDIVEILSADNGTVITSTIVDTSEYDGSFIASGNNQPFALMVLPCKSGSANSRIVMVGWDGEILVDADLPINILDPVNKTPRASWVCTSDNDIIGIVDSADSLICFIDLKTEKILNPDESNVIVRGDFNTPLLGENYDEPFDESRWKNHIWQPQIKGYLVCKITDESWGYVDSDDNEIVMYKDATDFNDAGYALVSDDRNKYYIIDTEFNKVGEIAGEGYIGAGMCGGHLFKVNREDGSFLEVIVK